MVPNCNTNQWWIVFFVSKVSLYKLIDGNWMLINESVTNSDGRCSDLLLRNAYQSGRYKLYFGVEKYFKSVQTTSIYPFIEVRSTIWLALSLTHNFLFCFEKEWSHGSSYLYCAIFHFYLADNFWLLGPKWSLSHTVAIEPIRLYDVQRIIMSIEWLNLFEFFFYPEKKTKINKAMDRSHDSDDVSDLRQQQKEK